jgi:phosphohistidine swiveling domain-containing protein
MESGPDTPWTTTNVGEAMPGVQTALGWTFWRDACERAVRENFWRLGALRRRELAVPASPDDRFSAVFYGRAAGNVRLFREMGDRLPGTSGDAVEEQLFGVRRSAVASSPRWDRYPVVVAKMPVAAIRSARRIMAALPAPRRAGARALLAASGRYLPLREVGKAAFLQTIDAARLAARSAGRLLAADGLITDPGWASIMFLAGALVVDVGGPMSHAAIVARELGVPCVVNTGDGTRRIRSGERIRVDGTTGLVERVVS